MEFNGGHKALQPKVSVIVPVYNVEKFLAGCLNSAINQTLVDIEIICVEDGSTDNSAMILKEYSKQDSRIRVIWHERNLGTGLARKHGVLAARGEYIMFLDSDDEFFPHACEVAYTSIKTNKTDVLEFGVKSVDSSGRKMYIAFLETEESTCLKDINLLYLWQKGKLKNWTILNKIFKVELCKKTFLEMEDAYYIMAEDVYISCIYWYYACSISMIEEELYLYHWGVGISTQIHSVITLDYYKKLLGVKDSLDAIIRFITSKPDKDKYNPFVQKIHDDWLHLAVSLWHENLAEEDKSEGFLELSQKWGMEETTKGLLWLINALINNGKQELTAMQQRAFDAELNLNAIRTGWSFKLGRIITYIPRKARDIFIKQD